MKRFIVNIIEATQEKSDICQDTKARLKILLKEFSEEIDSEHLIDELYCGKFLSINAIGAYFKLILAHKFVQQMMREGYDIEDTLCYVEFVLNNCLSEGRPQSVTYVFDKKSKYYHLFVQW